MQSSARVRWPLPIGAQSAYRIVVRNKHSGKEYDLSAGTVKFQIRKTVAGSALVSQSSADASGVSVIGGSVVVKPTKSVIDAFVPGTYIGAVAYISPAGVSIDLLQITFDAQLAGVR
jgi:hypothetical protein